MSATQFCIRACKEGPQGPGLCQHVYDTLGCSWNIPGDYDVGSFDDCLGDAGEVSAPPINPTVVYSFGSLG